MAYTTSRSGRLPDLSYVDINDAFRALTDDIELSDLAVASILFDEIDKMVDEGYPPELVAKIVDEILRGEG